MVSTNKAAATPNVLHTEISEKFDICINFKHSYINVQHSVFW